MAENNDKREEKLCLWIEDDYAQEIRDIALEEDRSVSSVLRRLVLSQLIAQSTLEED